MTYLEYAIQLMEENLKIPVFSIRPLDEGSHDHLLLLANLEYVVRLGREHPLDEPFRSKGAEYQLYAALSKKDLAMPIAPFLFFTNKRDKIERFVSGTPFSKEIAGPATIEPVVDAIIALHSVSLEIPEFDPFGRFRHYKAGNRKPLPDSFEKEILQRFQQIYESRPLVLSHNRLCGDNIRLNEEGATFLDMSLVGLNTPLFDLASFLEENDVDSTDAKRALLRFSSLTLDSPYSFEELETTMLFLDAFWYYYATNMFHKTKDNKFKAMAETKKKRFLFAFEARLMEGQE